MRPASIYLALFYAVRPVADRTLSLLSFRLSV
jgi:hypothetical protein